MNVPNLVSATANGGTVTLSPTFTASKLTSIELVFDAAVDPDEGAFSLRTPYGFGKRLTDRPGGGILVAVAGVNVNLTFDAAAAAVDYDSLSDGDWSLRINNALLVGTVVGNVRRLFGDSTGDGTVDLTDFGEFGSAFNASVGDPNFDPEFDFNGDGTVDGTDFAEFGNRFGVTL